jgi:hypothetical protein
MAYSNAKLKSSDGEASPCFVLFWTGTLSDNCWPIRIYLDMSLKHVLIDRTNFMGIANSVQHCTILTSSLNHRRS